MDNLIFSIDRYLEGKVGHKRVRLARTNILIKDLYLVH